jgi:hypothetical protein
MAVSHSLDDRRLAKEWVKTARHDRAHRSSLGASERPGEHEDMIPRLSIEYMHILA